MYKCICGVSEAAIAKDDGHAFLNGIIITSVSDLSSVLKPGCELSEFLDVL